MGSIYDLDAYTEDIDYYVLDGEGGEEDRRVILPSELDLVAAEIDLDQAKRALQIVTGGEKPAEIEAAEESLETAKGELLKVRSAAVKEWYQKRSFQIEQAEYRVKALQAALEDMEGIFGQELPPTHRERFRMRELSFDERLSAEDNRTEVSLDPTAANRVNANRRNLDMLALAFDADGGNYGAKGLGVMAWALNGKPPEKYEALEEPGRLGYRRVEILIARMWVRNQMDAQLVNYFRRRREKHRGGVDAK
jgi:hypothetical protein